jgi:hypothetical protein
MYLTSFWVCFTHKSQIAPNKLLHRSRCRVVFATHGFSPGPVILALGGTLVICGIIGMTCSARGVKSNGLLSGQELTCPSLHTGQISSGVPLMYPHNEH